MRRLALTAVGLAIAARTGAPLRSWVKSSGDLETMGPAASPTSQATTPPDRRPGLQEHDTYFAGAVLQGAHPSQNAEPGSLVAAHLTSFCSQGVAQNGPSMHLEQGAQSSSRSEQP